MNRCLLACCIAVLLTGCAAKKPIPQRTFTFSLVVPNYCIEKIEKGPDTYCRGHAIDKLMCFKIVLTKKKGCEQLEVAPER